MASAQNLHFETKLGVPSAESQALPFYPLLPKDRVGLLKWRLYCRERCVSDMEFRAAIEHMCAHDVVFFASTFAVFHETRAVTEFIGKFPVILDLDQVDLLCWLAKYAGRTDITVEKTRGIGLSYLICLVFLWVWLYRGEQLELALVSKDKDSLDIKDRPSTLMGKLDLLISELPFWMTHTSKGANTVDRTTTNHLFVNRKNGNSIRGFVPTDDKLRSGRFFAVGVDEAAFLPIEDQRWLASSQGVTFSRIWVSTHDGTACMFYRLTIDDRHKLVRISTWWWANTRCARGLYKSENGRIVLLDPQYKYDGDYPFSHDMPGLLRSPWVDDQFNRPGADLVHLKQELYGVAVLDMKRLIQPRVTDIARSTCTRPIAVGEFGESGHFEEDLGGRWRWWKHPDLPFDGGPYFIGVDPALSRISGANAALTAINSKTGEVVVTAALEDVDPVDFARLVHALAKLIAGPRGAGYAVIVPEVTGVGVSFLTELQRLRWPAIYSEPGGSRVGVHNADGGEKWLLAAARAIGDADVTVRDARIVDDLEHFELDSRLQPRFTGGVGHGDLGMSFAIAFWGCRERRRQVRQAEKGPVVHSLLREPRILAEKKSRLFSDQFLTKRV